MFIDHVLTDNIAPAVRQLPDPPAETGIVTEI